MVNRNERHVHLSKQFLSMYFLGQSIKASREQKMNRLLDLVCTYSPKRNAIIQYEIVVHILLQEVVHTPFVPVLQPAFQPSSTPTHLMHRFMVCTTLKVTKPWFILSTNKKIRVIEATHILNSWENA